MTAGALQLGAGLLLAFASPFVQALELRDISHADEQRVHREHPSWFGAGSGAAKEEPSQAQLDNVIRELMKQGGYESVAFERKSDGEYAIIARPLRSIEEIRFTGEDAFPRAKLLEVIELQPGEKFDRKKAVSAGEKLKQFYGESGYFNTVINLSFPKGKEQNVILKFEIQENAPCRVMQVELKTDNKILKNRLADRMTRYLQKPLTDDLLQNLSRRTTGYFIDHRYLTAELNGPDIRYNDDKSAAYLSYEIKDAYRWEFFFDGNVFDSTLDIFQALDWSNHDRKNVEPASEGAERIKRDYLSKGFPQIKVDFQVDADSKEYLKKVFYDIHEGFRVHLKTIEIQGRVSRPSAYYADFITNNSSELIAHGYYNRQDLEDGFKNLATELRNQGYLKARIQSSRIEYDPTRQNAIVYVLLDEGPLTLIQSVDFDGNHFISNYELRDVLGLSTNSPLHLTELERGIEKLKGFYRNQGFLEMKLLNEGEDVVRYNESGTLARLLLKIFEGPRVRIAAVRVEGNTFTKTYVILKEAHFQVGEILTPEKEDNAIERLNRMGLFSRVDIHTLEENTSVSERTLIISVTDRDPGLVRFGAGVNSERDLTARGFTSFSYNNLGGTARAVSARLQLSDNIAHVHYPESDITVGYLEPFLFDSLTRGRVNFTRSEHVFEYNTDPTIIQANGQPLGIPLTQLTLTNLLTVNLERDFNRHFRGTWKLWSQEERKDYELHSNCLNLTTNSVAYCAPDVKYVATMGPILDIDYRDNAFAPSSGSLTKLIAEYSDPTFGSSGEINFYHLELHETYYMPILKNSKRWVWANHTRGGYIDNVSGRPGSGIPVSHAFFLGGVDTVRGFDFSRDNERIPPQYDLPITEGNQIVIQKDSEYFLVKSELRFPLVGDHGGVLFYDGGAVFIRDVSIPSPYRDSVGVGYRYNTPVGSVSLDIAFKTWQRNTPLGWEAPFRIHFSISSF